ncbi:MAG TPA: hypothetical protein VLF42_07480 [Burkholderiales bacterium]|nr:hypothetical protein [Burkholderiales bacterium]
MTISEPVTLATDYLLAGVTAWLCVLLWKQRASQRSRRWWTTAFGALALGAFLGGTWHGLLQSDLLWKATVLAIGVASGAMLAGSAYAVLSGAPRALLLALAGVKFLVYAAVMLARDEFIFFVIDSGVTFALVAALHLWRFNGWIVAGVALSLLAALAQASGLALHRHFNHNDLYHVIQVAAMLLFYRGARRLTDSVVA